MSTKDILIVVGNGIAISLHKTYPIANQLDPSRPISWNFNINQDSLIAWQDAFPRLNKYISENLAKLGNDFELFRSIRSEEQEGKLEIEARHFLALAYAHYSINTCVPHTWQWLRFLREYSPRMLSIVSFNYDLILEKALTKARQKACYGGYLEGHCTILKPHGSCNLESHPNFIQMPDPIYPINIWMNCNDVPQHYLDPENYMKPRKEAYCILPHESNRYINFQWQQPFWDSTVTKIGSVTDCILVGLSYHPADRLEIDRIIELLNDDATVHLCDPSPSKDLIEMIKKSGRKVVPWYDGVPQNI